MTAFDKFLKRVMIAIPILAMVIMSFLIGVSQSDSANKHMPPQTCPEGYTMVKAEGEMSTLCISPAHICEYYISCPDSNYEIKCTTKPEIRVKNPDISGWE